MGAAGESRRKGVWKEKGGGKVNEGQDEGKEGVKNCRRAELFWYQKIPNILLYFHTHFIKNQEGEAPTITSDKRRSP